VPSLPSVLCLVPLLAALWVWSRRIPGQVLALALSQFAALTVGLSLLLRGSPETVPQFPWPAILISMGTLPLARWMAAALCRGRRASRHYGFVLTAVAVVLATLPIGLTFQTPTPAPGPRSWPGWIYWTIIPLWCLGAYLITLPCWLDKRNPYQTGTPVPR